MGIGLIEYNSIYIERLLYIAEKPLLRLLPSIYYSYIKEVLNYIPIHPYNIISNIYTPIIQYSSSPISFLFQ